MAYTDNSTKTFVSTNDLSEGGANTAGANSTSGQFLIMKMDSTANQVVPATAATDKLIGVNMSKPKALDYADIRLRSAMGTLQVVAGGTIAIGDPVTSNSSGQAITTSTTGHQILGYALYAAASGDIFEVMPSTGKF